MSSTLVKEETTVVLDYDIAASRERVFEAFTDPKLLERWWGPGAWKCTFQEHDARVGGEFRFTMVKDGTGETFHLRGRYLEVDAPKRLVWTTADATDATAGETTVTATFTATNDGCELRIVHEDFPDVETRDHHRVGWLASLELLREIMEDQPETWWEAFVRDAFMQYPGSCGGWLQF